MIIHEKSTVTNETSPRVNALPGPDFAQVVILPPALYLGTLFLGFLIHFFLPLHLTTNSWVRLFGIIPVLAGVFLAGWGRWTLVRAGTNVVPSQPTLAIVTDGPFRFTRNPLYLGGSIAFIGLSILLNSAWPLILLVPSLVILDWGVIRREERYLETKFGPIYLAYKSRVRRWC
jgi:protein-S-isoprenylcysteine O-methyltransferase Ste14